MWNTTIKEHHEHWKHHKVPDWINPEGVPLKKQYSENIPADHKKELEAVQWRSHEKVDSQDQLALKDLLIFFVKFF